MKNMINKTTGTLAALVIAMMVPSGASAQSPVQKIFDAIATAIEPVSQNKTVILSVIGLIGLILGIVAWGTDATSQNPQLTKLIKGFVVLLVFVEILFIFIA